MGSDFDNQIEPALDGVSNYDYTGGIVQNPDLVEDLHERIAGEVRFDDYSRQRYATDASIYEVTPIGIVFPRSTDDVAAVMRYCAEREVPVLPRCGGTSLAGQAVNEAVILDFTRHMDSLVTFRPRDRRAHVQPGITLGKLNGELAPEGLKFAPDPAWGDKSVLGGAVGNNSTGAHSPKYGKTDAYIKSYEVVLADGTVTEFEEISRDELRERADPDGNLEARIHAEIERILTEEREELEQRYPDIKRNVSGYNLDCLVGRSTDRTINIAKLLAGSEGTLAIVTEVEISLEPVPESKSMALNRKLYGNRLWNLFWELKTTFDPEWLLNPGQVCGDVSMTENLRFDPDYEFEASYEPMLEWDNVNGMQGMVELCHGCGGVVELRRLPAE